MNFDAVNETTVNYDDEAAINDIFKDYERGDAAGKERQERTADGWHLSYMEELRKQKG